MPVGVGDGKQGEVFVLQAEDAAFGGEEPVAGLGRDDADGGSAQDVVDPMPFVIDAHQGSHDGKAIGAGAPPTSIFDTDQFGADKGRRRVSGREGVPGRSVRTQLADRNLRG